MGAPQPFSDNSECDNILHFFYAVFLYLFGFSLFGRHASEGDDPDFPPRYSGEIRVFFGPAVRTAGKPDAAAMRRVFVDLTRVTNDLLISAVEAKSAEGFRSVRQQRFADYVHLMRAKSDFIRIAVFRNDQQRAEAVLQQSLSALESDFREHGARRFGTEVRDQAVFSVWLLRKSRTTLRRSDQPNSDECFRLRSRRASRASFRTSRSIAHGPSSMFIA